MLAADADGTKGIPASDRAKVRRRLAKMGRVVLKVGAEEAAAIADAHEGCAL